MRHLLKNLEEVLGKNCVITKPSAMASALEEWRGKHCGRACGLLFPRTVEQVQRCVVLIREGGGIVVPQGGNTGLVGAQTPNHPNAFILSMRNLDAVRSFHVPDQAIVAEAGCTIATLQQTAQEQGCHFPLSLASQESCTVGGVLSTNAGGHHVVRFGSARTITLGVEVVLPDGTLISELSPVIKNNTGYDWKHLLIGAEGTLGIITAACLRVHSYPTKTMTFFASLPSLDVLHDVCHRMNGALLGCVAACELMSKTAMDMAFAHGERGRLPTLPSIKSPWGLLIEVISHHHAPEWEAYVISVLTEMQTRHNFVDVRMGATGKQQEALWYWRSLFSEAQKREGASLKHDIALPLGCLPRFLQEVESQAKHILPDIRPVLFGHVGDGNIHCNFSTPKSMAPEVFALFALPIESMVYDLVKTMGGSVSAEHGIGRAKKHLLTRTRTKDSIAIMRKIKKIFDPDHVFNPGVLFEKCPNKNHFVKIVKR